MNKLLQTALMAVLLVAPGFAGENQPITGKATFENGTSVDSGTTLSLADGAETILADGTTVEVMGTLEGPARGKATIKYIADLPKGTDVKVYYLNDAGELEEMDATYQNGNIIFSSNHYSKFVLTATAEVTTPNKPNRPNRPHRPAKPAEPAGPEVPVVPTMPVFDDVAEDYWAKEAIAWAAEQGYVTGTGAGEYLPENNVSRQQIWMMLSRISGENAESMAAAKAWAMANGISDGTNPGTAVTRQQLVTLLYRYAILMGYDVSVGEDTNILSYDDVFSVSEYAIPAFQWACGAGVVNGTTERMLSPLGTATRAQFAVMLQRFCEKVVKEEKAKEGTVMFLLFFRGQFRFAVLQ